MTNTTLSHLYNSALKTNDAIEHTAPTRIKKLHLRFLDILLMLLVSKRRLPKPCLQELTALCNDLSEFYSFSLF